MAFVGIYPVYADPAGSDHTYIGQGHQYASWLKGYRSVSLLADARSGMDPDHCMDAMLDWEVADGHYDSRVVRTCQPGGSLKPTPPATILGLSRRIGTLPHPLICKRVSLILWTTTTTVVLTYLPGQFDSKAPVPGRYTQHPRVRPSTVGHERAPGIKMAT